MDWIWLYPLIGMLITIVKYPDYKEIAEYKMFDRLFSERERRLYLGILVVISIVLWPIHIGETIYHELTRKD